MNNDKFPLIFPKYDLHKLEPFGNDNLNPFFLIKKNKIFKFKIIKNFISSYNKK